VEDHDLNDKNPSSSDEQRTAGTNGIAHKLSIAGWSLFFIWIGISFLAKFTVAIGLLGIGLITLGIQLARRAFNLAVESFLSLFEVGKGFCLSLAISSNSTIVE